MPSALLFFELKTGFANNGPAYIGYAARSKSGRTLFFNGKAFRKSTRCSSGNFFEIESEEEYWISGVKGTGTDRLHGANGPTYVDRQALAELLDRKGWTSLPSGFEVFDAARNLSMQQTRHEQENRPGPSPSFPNSRSTQY